MLQNFFITLLLFILPNLALLSGGLSAIISLFLGILKNDANGYAAPGSALALVALVVFFQSDIFLPFVTFIPPNIEGCVNLWTYIAGIVFSVLAIWLLKKSKKMSARICYFSLFYILLISYIRAMIETYG